MERKLEKENETSKQKLRENWEDGREAGGNANLKWFDERRWRRKEKDESASFDAITPVLMFNRHTRRTA